MIAPSAYQILTTKVLYRKTTVNGIEIFEYSNDPEEELFNVRFSLVAPQGNYILKTPPASVSMNILPQ
jgi:hypothetical protein